MIKTKPCKAQDKAFGYEGCGKDTDVRTRKYGLCPVCFWDWMQTTEAGKIHYQKQFIPQVKKVDKKRIQKEKIDLMTVNQYREKYVQPKINKIARMIDYRQPCIATGRTTGKMAGGHFYSVGAHPELCLNLHNIHQQCFESNSFRGGDERNYAVGLHKRYGFEYLEFVKSLKGGPELRLRKPELKEIKEGCQELLNGILKEPVERSEQERIWLRNYVNETLGIYGSRYAIFKTTITNNRYA